MYSDNSTDVKVLDSVEDYIKLLAELGKIIDSCEELEFSTGKWSKAWIKIKYRRINNGT